MVCSGRAGKEASLFEVHQSQKKNLLANSNEHLIFVSRFYCLLILATRERVYVLFQRYLVIRNVLL